MHWLRAMIADWQLGIEDLELETLNLNLAGLGGRFSREYDKVFFRDTLLEDVSIVGHTQAMLACGAKQALVWQDNELLICYHHKVTEGYLNSLPLD